MQQKLVNPYRNLQFLQSAAKISQLPKDSLKEIAFAGRSNSGKSSALNFLAEQKGLARTSRTPGRTQLINLFQLEVGIRLVDLPGYGYAKVALHTKLAWQTTLTEYLQSREVLKGLVLLSDSRHPLAPLDIKLLELALERKLPIHILLSKADKLNRSQNRILQQQISARFSCFPYISVQNFSVTAKYGLDQLIARLNKWLA